MLTLFKSMHWLSLHGLIVVLGLLIYVVTTHSLQQRRTPAAAVSWVLVIGLIPYLGLPLYLMFGTRKLVHAGKRHTRDVLSMEQGMEAQWPLQLAASMGQPPVASYQNLHIHANGGEALQALWDVIDGAKHDLTLCTFIIGRDPVGKALIARLIDKAQKGVRIRLLLDSFGYLLAGRPSLRKLRAVGVEVKMYSPLFHVSLKSRSNLRNHRKMVVADATRLWCGGRNFAAEYFNGTRSHPAWHDLSIDLTGPLVEQADALFDHDWAYTSATHKQLIHSEQVSPPFAQVIASGPDQADDTVHDLLVTACFRAQRRIIAVTPYFVPSDALLMALSLAARRGVRVDLVLPHHSNHKMADFARHRALRTLSSAGAHIWQVPYMLHAKAVVVDDTMALVGSVNLDARSLFLNYEMMLAFYSSEDVRRFADFIDTHRLAATQYRVHRPGLWRDFTEGLLLWLAFQL